MAIEWEKENDCVSCERCINCGRGDYDSAILICDSCKDECEELYETPDGMFCDMCLHTVFKKITYRDVMENIARYKNG